MTQFDRYLIATSANLVLCRPACKKPGCDSDDVRWVNRSSDGQDWWRCVRCATEFNEQMPEEFWKQAQRIAIGLLEDRARELRQISANVITMAGLHKHPLGEAFRNWLENRGHQLIELGLDLAEKWPPDHETALPQRRILMTGKDS